LIHNTICAFPLELFRRWFNNIIKLYQLKKCVVWDQIFEPLGELLATVKLYIGTSQIQYQPLF